MTAPCLVLMASLTPEKSLPRNISLIALTMSALLALFCMATCPLPLKASSMNFRSMSTSEDRLRFKLIAIGPFTSILTLENIGFSLLGALTITSIGSVSVPGTTFPSLSRILPDAATEKWNSCGSARKVGDLVKVPCTKTLSLKMDPKNCFRMLPTSTEKDLPTGRKVREAVLATKSETEAHA